MTSIRLYDYWRSSASYRVRIALNLKRLEYTGIPVDLVAGEHRLPDHLKRHPQGLVPAIEIDGVVLTQSLAIIEYLDELFPDIALLPAEPEQRARMRALCHAIAMDIHPICNLSVANHVVDLTGGGDEARRAWMQHFIHKGLSGFEGYLSDGYSGNFCHGDMPGMADCCLMPQLYNAERWGVDYTKFAVISRIKANCTALAAFSRAHPDNTVKA